MQTALNHMTVPKLGYVPFLDLAAKLGCVGVEVRNDIRRALFDDIDPTEAGRIARDKGLRLVGLSQVYPFNDWTPEREDAVKALIATAKASGAETISLIPRNDGTAFGNGERRANLRVALKGALPLLQDAEIVNLWASSAHRCVRKRSWSSRSPRSAGRTISRLSTIRSITLWPMAARSIRR